MRTIACILVSSSVASSAWGASIGLFSDPACASSALTAAYGSVVTLAVSYSGRAGLTYAEFRIGGLPADWELLNVAANPAAATVLGDPFGAGVQIGFASGQPESSCLDLLAIQVRASSAVSDRVLSILPHENPRNPEYNCPLAGGTCDGACTWQLCVLGGSLYINSSVGVEKNTWVGLKRLYE